MPTAGLTMSMNGLGVAGTTRTHGNRCFVDGPQELHDGLGGGSRTMGRATGCHWGATPTIEPDYAVGGVRALLDHKVL